MEKHSKTSDDVLSASMNARVNAALKYHTENLCPSEEYLKTGSDLCTKIIQILKDDGYKVVRYTHTGNCKEMSIFLDAEQLKCYGAALNRVRVLFANRSKPQFFVRRLQLTGWFFNLRVNSFIIKLMLAPNYVSNISAFEKKDFKEATAYNEYIIEQHHKALNMEAQKPSYKNSLAIIEAQLAFIATKDDFSHQVIKLAKYWLKTVFTPTSIIFGMDSFMEIVMLKVDMEERILGSPTHLTCFKKFLTLIMTFEDLFVCFEDSYENHEVPESLLDEHPLVLELCNPFHNLAKHWDPISIKGIKAVAKITLGRLSRIQANDFAKNFRAVFNNINCPSMS